MSISSSAVCFAFRSRLDDSLPVRQVYSEVFMQKRNQRPDNVTPDMGMLATSGTAQIESIAYGSHLTTSGR